MKNKRPAQIKINKNSQSKNKVVSSPLKDNRQISLPSASQSPVSPSPKRKQRQIFLTRKPTTIEQAHQELLDYVDVVDSKMVNHIEKHEAQFLVAYRNHVKRMREEMEQIRNKSINNANSSVSQTQKIQFLQKQLVLFRQESLNLFDKMYKKEKTIELLEKKTKTLETENYQLHENIKKMTKRNKYLEVEVNQKMNSETKNEQTEKEFQFSDINNSVNYRPYTTAISKNRIMRIRNNSVQLNSQRTERKNMYYSQELHELTLKIDSLLGNQKEILRDQIKRQIENFLKSKSLMDRFPPSSQTSSFKATQNISMMEKMIKNQKEREISNKSEMETYFNICVDTVRKEIIRRKGIKTLNFYSEHKSITFEQFKKLDFFRLLELIISNDKVIKAVHKTLFSE